MLVILNHNSLKSLGSKSVEFLRSILSTDYPELEVVVVDNASSDSSDVVIEKELRKGGKGKLVRLRSNLGYAGGNNYGFRRFGSGCKYVAFLNNDIEVEPDWLKRIVEVLENDESIGAAQPKILQLRDRNLIDSLGGFIDRIGRAYDVFHGLPDNAKIEGPFEVFYARGAAIVLRSDVFRRLGCFDEDYFIYYEETDLCWRARLLGYRVVTVPTARVYHLGGGTSGGATPHTIYLRRRNQLATLIKNYSLGNAIKYSVLLTAIYLASAARRSLHRKDLQVSRSIVSAILWNLRNMRRIMRKRAAIQSSRKVPDREVSRHMLGILEYDRLVKYIPKAY